LWRPQGRRRVQLYYPSSGGTLTAFGLRGYITKIVLVITSLLDRSKHSEYASLKNYSFLLWSPSNSTSDADRGTTLCFSLFQLTRLLPINRQ
jgi:hypothetical protein